MNEKYCNERNWHKKGLRRSKTTLNFRKKLGLTVDINAIQPSHSEDPSKPTIIPHTTNLYLIKQNPLLRRHSFYVKGKLFK